MILKDLTTFQSQFNEYTELRAQENKTMGITLLNGNPVRNSSSAESGISARVYNDGSWGFSSNPTINTQSVEAVIKSSQENAKFMSKKNTNRCGIILPETVATDEVNFSSNKEKKEQKFWIDFLKMQLLAEYFHPKQCQIYL